MPELVDLDRLRAAWKTVSKRTNVLRTKFFHYELELLQVVVEEHFRWKVVDRDLATFLATEAARTSILARQYHVSRCCDRVTLLKNTSYGRYPTY